MVVGHERDGRGWKAEWSALPEVCLLTGTALDLARRLISGLVVDDNAMAANLDRLGGQLASELLLSRLTGSAGAMVDAVVGRARAAQAAEPDRW